MGYNSPDPFEDVIFLLLVLCACLAVVTVIVQVFYHYGGFTR